MAVTAGCAGLGAQCAPLRDGVVFYWGFGAGWLGQGLSHRPAIRARSCIVKTRSLWGLSGSSIKSSGMLLVRIDEVMDWGYARD